MRYDRGQKVGIKLVEENISEMSFHDRESDETVALFAMIRDGAQNLS